MRLGIDVNRFHHSLYADLLKRPPSLLDRLDGRFILYSCGLGICQCAKTVEKKALKSRFMGGNAIYFTPLCSKKAARYPFKAKSDNDVAGIDESGWIIPLL